MRKKRTLAQQIVIDARRRSALPGLKEIIRRLAKNKKEYRDKQ